MAADDASGEGAAGYAVLARKYRPQTFDALIGQEALVRVMTNAFARGRVPHAILLTGVRGVGKTTTARIIAKGLNCSAADGPTVSPCGVCDNCVAIAESRHVDVMEMDAASRTGIDDIREIIESVRYRANIGRYKVYIIDETHMLSKNAFNGLLKTLEEPPPHVKFILATTDAHKLPATVLSRCMRFDLRRVPPERMIAHLAALCEAEGVTAAREALALIARASEGSVRDALSLLDQAIAHGAGEVSAEAVRAMLGLSETGRAFELFESIVTGAVGEALERLNALYRDGADPGAILADVAAACHTATVLKAAPARAEMAAEDATLSPTEIAMGRALAERTPMRALTRSWQMLLKALDEVATAPAPLAAAEMAVIRMSYVSELPSPEQALRRLAGAPGSPASGGLSGGSAPSARGGGAPERSAAGRAATASLPAAPPRPAAPPATTPVHRPIMASA
ncbi:MAG: DNA polymerase III subunit gamma/tau, partial [Pseudomonadota bacterium]